MSIHSNNHKHFVVTLGCIPNKLISYLLDLLFKKNEIPNKSIPIYSIFAFPFTRSFISIHGCYSWIIYSKDMLYSVTICMSKQHPKRVLWKVFANGFSREAYIFLYYMFFRFFLHKYVDELTAIYPKGRSSK